MIRRAHVEFGTLQSKELQPKRTKENGIFVADDGIGKTIQSENLFHKDLGNLWGTITMLQCHNMDKFE